MRKGVVRETDDNQNINTRIKSKMALMGSRSEARRVYPGLCPVGAKSRISEMLISLRRRKPSKSAVSSEMILVSLGHDDLSYCTRASARLSKSGRIYDPL